MTLHNIEKPENQNNTLNRILNKFLDQETKTIDLKATLAHSTIQKLNTIDVVCSLYYIDDKKMWSIDFDYASHEDTIKVIQAIGGVWNKVYNNDSCDYTRRMEIDEPFIVRIFRGELPPHCQVIEEEVTIPETWIPAHIEIKRSVKCL